MSMTETLLARWPRRRQRDADPHQRAPPRRAADLDAPAKRGGALLHAEQPELPVARNRRARHPFAVVAHVEAERGPLTRQRNLHARRVGVARDVGQDLDENAEQRRRSIRIDAAPGAQTAK